MNKSGLFSTSAIAALGIVALISGSAVASTIELGASTAAGGPTTILATGTNIGTSFVGPYAGLDFNVLGAVDPAPNGPVSRLGSTLLASSFGGTSGTAYFYVTETGVTSPASSDLITTHFTENALPTNWSVVETAYLDNSNTPFGMGTSLGGVTANGTLSTDVNSGSVAIMSPYSLTEVYQLNYTTTAGSALSTIKITAASGVPEVSTWAMMLLGFAGLGFAGYKRSPGRDRTGQAALGFLQPFPL